MNARIIPVLILVVCCSAAWDATAMPGAQHAEGAEKLVHTPAERAVLICAAVIVAGAVLLAPMLDADEPWWAIVVTAAFPKPCAGEASSG